MYCNKCNKKMKETKGTYHYKECGLDNLILQEIPLYQCKCGTKVPILSHIDALHGFIANILTSRKEPLNGKELRFIRKMMGMKAVELANFLGVTKQTVSKWENGKVRISPPNDMLVKAMYHCPDVSKFKEKLTTVSEPEVHLHFPTFLASTKLSELKEEICY